MNPQHLSFRLKRSNVLALLAVLALAGAACSGQKTSGDSTTATEDANTGDVSAIDAIVGTDAVSTSDASTPTVKGFAIDSVEPAEGKASGSETIYLYGHGFTDGAQILFGSTPLEASSVYVFDDATIQIITPPHETGLVDITVVLPGDVPQSATLAKAFLYFNDVLVTKVDPPEGPTAGGTAITVHGTGFTGNCQVLVGGKQALNVQVVADDTVTAITPPGTFGSVPVHVLNERGTGLLKKGFFYTAAPTVSSVAPASGPTAGGTSAIVYGTGFSKDVDLQIGTGKATVLEVKGSTQARITTPPGAAGKADVTATTAYGSNALVGGYVYSDDKGQAATKILSIAPPAGPLAGGNKVAIIATGLLSKGDTTVLFGQKLAEILSVDAVAHTALVLAPAGSSVGATDVTLMTSKGTDLATGGYTYSDLLTVTSITPNAGPSEGGTKIVLTGSGFSKGSVNVKIGALAASAVAVVSDSEIQAITPPGQPGYADVTVLNDTSAVTLTAGYTYTGGKLALYVVYPPMGAQAGGTLVHVYGQGFDASTGVTFAGNPATHFTFIDPGHVTVKTPPGKVGSVDVSVTVKDASATLHNGYAYFNPMSGNGGTWGSGVDGAVNITVLDASNNAPIADAFAMLWTDPTTPYQGYTNSDGQITFSGDDLSGKQMVSASKTGYDASSVVLFDAQNVTVHLHPTSPPSPGDPPPGKIPPTISGHVIGVDKYVFVPNGNCNQYSGSGPGATCNSCSADSQCGANFACVEIGPDGDGNTNGKRCVADCSQGQGCPAQFKCAGIGTAGFRCIPAAGEVVAFCEHTKDGLFSQDNNPPEGAGFIADPQKAYAYKIDVAPGEQAVICFGGYKTFGAVLQADDPNAMVAFTPTVMGIKRHVMVQPEEQVTGVDVKLDIPLGTSASVRLDNPPTWGAPASTIVNYVQPQLVLGSDGVLRWPTRAYKFDFESNADLLTLTNLPSSFSGDLADASLTIETFLFDINEPTQLPRSINIKDNVRALADDRMIRRLVGGDFESVETGVKKNIYGLWGTSTSNIYAVGAQGSLWHWDGGGWTQQATVAKADWRGVFGVSAQSIFAVGLAGTAAVFDGLSWKVAPVAGNQNLTGVFAAQGTKGVVAFASSQSGIYQYDATNGWQKNGLYSNYLAIHGADATHMWAVGMTGALAFWDGNSWQNQTSGTSIALRDVWAASPNLVYAVGEKGIILKYDGKTWKPMNSGVQSTLSSVWGNGADDVWAVGARGVVLHYNGKSWQKVPGQALDKLLDAVWTTPEGDLFALGEQELLITPLLYPPLAVTPSPDGILVGNKLKWNVDTSYPEPHFNWISIGEPNPMAPGDPSKDTPVWNIVQKGSVSEVELPDFPSIQGSPGITKGKQLRLTIIRGYKEGFDIDAYTETDLNAYHWHAWAEHMFFFTAQ